MSASKAGPHLQEKKDVAGKMTSADEIVGRLAARRRELRMTFDVLAKRMGYSLSTVKCWEQRRRQPRLRALCDWCDALGVEIEIRD